MVIVYLFAALLGAATTVAFFASDSWLVALLCAPIGRSALTLRIVVSVDALSAKREPSRATLASPTS